MPRISRVKAKHHAPAAQLPSKRSFALPENQVDGKVLPESGAAEESSSSRLFNNDVPEPSTSRTRIKQPQSALVPAQPAHPYSRSHIKREKRKAKEQLSGGGLNPLVAALTSSLGVVMDVNFDAGTGGTKGVVLGKRDKEEERRKLEERGKIGEGKGRTLSEKARRGQIKLEAKRIPIISQHPEFRKNPWATIRLHAGNSVAFNEPRVEAKV